MTDEALMERALQLAMLGSGFVSPNPKVGAVITKNGRIISEGWHKQYGENHAEVDAIEKLSYEDCEGATLYVNLEPCSHHGKTPPCAPLIIERGIAKVIVGMVDPNPEVSGKGIEMLKEAGIETEVGILEQDCRWLNRFFIKNITTGLPYVILKAAQSIDGCIATSRGESKWITGEESRKRTHALRAQVDAVLIGKLTATIDNPQLTVRDVSGRNPKRIIFDTNLSLPLGINTFKDVERDNVIVCCKPEAESLRKAGTLRVAGIQVLPVSLNEKKQLDIPEALFAISDKFNIASILVEGGANMFSSFIQSDMVDEYHFFISPKIVGNGKHTFADFNLAKLSDSPNLSIIALSQSGDDIHLIAEKQH